MKKIFFVLINLIIVMQIFSINIDKIIAKIGDEIILKSDLEKNINQLKTMNNIPKGITKLDVLNKMVETKLVIQKAKEKKYSVDEIKVEELANDQLKQIEKKFPDHKTFINELKKANLNPVDLKEYYKKMITEQKLKDQIIQNEIKSKVHVTSAEVEEFYNEKKDSLPLRPEMDKIGMIMRTVKPSKTTDRKALKDINKIIDELNNGADFAELAKKESDDYSGKNGGDLGFFSRGMMVKPFEDAAFSLQPGQISKVVKTRFGYHVIKMEEKRGDEIRVSHILKLVKPTELDIKAEMKLMNNIVSKLRAGADFSELAKTYSEDDSTAVRGGVLGEFPKDQYPELFKPYLTPLKYGETSDVVKQDNILYIFKKIKKIPSRQYKFSEIENKIKNMAMANKEEDLYKEWIKNIKKESYIEIDFNDDSEIK
jgi:peptidyl-prolyl cis-trans isomerase SurA